MLVLPSLFTEASTTTGSHAGAMVHTSSKQVRAPLPVRRGGLFLCLERLDSHQCTVQGVQLQQQQQLKQHQKHMLRENVTKHMQQRKAYWQFRCLVSCHHLWLQQQSPCIPASPIMLIVDHWHLPSTSWLWTGILLAALLQFASLGCGNWFELWLYGGEWWDAVYPSSLRQQ